jgi:hypothetical protein
MVGQHIAGADDHRNKTRGELGNDRNYRYLPSAKNDFNQKIFFLVILSSWRIWVFTPADDRRSLHGSA